MKDGWPDRSQRVKAVVARLVETPVSKLAVQGREKQATNVYVQLIVCLLCCFLVSPPLWCLSFSTTASDLQQVLLLIQQGKLSAAEASLKKAEAEQPNNVAVYKLLGIVYQRRAQFLLAEQMLEKAVALSKEKDPQLLFLLCRVKFALKKQNEALRLANQISALAGDNPIAHYSLGQLLRANGSTAEGTRELKKAHELALENPAFTTELIIGYLGENSEKQAGILMASFFQHASYDDLVQAGARFGDAGQFAAAEQAFELAVRRQPAAYDALFNLAFAYYRQGNLQEALAALDQIGRQAAEAHWDYHYLLGKIYLGLHQNQAAAAEMLGAFNLQPGNESLCSDAGLLFFRFENFWKALQIYQTCAAHLPDSAPIETGLGLTYFRLGKYQDAIATFRKVLAIRPKADAAREALGFLLYIEGDLEEARAALEERATAQHGDYYIDYLDALVLLRLHPTGSHPEALRLLNETLRKDPGFAPAYFERARIWEDCRNFGQALTDLHRAIEADPHYAQPYYLIAQTDYKLGKMKEANEARLRFGALNTEREEKEQEQQVEDQLLQSFR